MAMLASVLPGLREVRAPLAAGFIWLVSLWFLIEPNWPEHENSGVVASANHLLANLSILGQGVAISFVAYILGSFSVFLFSNRLARSITTSLDSTGRLSGLSAAGKASLKQVATDGRQRIEAALALSGLQASDVLAQTRPVAPVQQDGHRAHRWLQRLPRPHRRVAFDKRWWQLWLARVDRQQMELRWIPPETSAEVVEGEISQRVLRDLPAVADAQLLGRETEVFAAVDRDRAEVDFRIALVPAVVALGISIAVASRSDQWLFAATCLVAGGLAASALMLDAARQHRTANELILSLMEHQRIIPPAISRVVSTATELADQAPGKEVVRRGETAVRAIHRTMADVSRVGDSSVLVGPDAARATRQEASEECAKLENLMGRYADAAPSRPTGEDVLHELDYALMLIEEFMQDIQRGHYSQEAVEAANARLAEIQRQATATLGEYGRRIRAVAVAAAAEDSARLAISATTPAPVSVRTGASDAT